MSMFSTARRGSGESRRASTGMAALQQAFGISPSSPPQGGGMEQSPASNRSDGHGPTPARSPNTTPHTQTQTQTQTHRKGSTTPTSAHPSNARSPDSNERRTSVGMTALREAMGSAATPAIQGKDSIDDIDTIDDRLDVLAHSLSHDVIPGIERELSKVRGWLAILEARPSSTQDVLKAKTDAKHKYDALDTAIKTFKASMGPMYTPNVKAARLDHWMHVDHDTQDTHSHSHH